MKNLLDNAVFTSVPGMSVPGSPDVATLVQRARQDPRGFEEYVRQTNPQAYQRAMQLRGTANPQALVMQMAQAQGIAPNVLRMFGL